MVWEGRAGLAAWPTEVAEGPVARVARPQAAWPTEVRPTVPQAGPAFREAEQREVMAAPLRTSPMVAEPEAPREPRQARVVPTRLDAGSHPLSRLQVRAEPVPPSQSAQVLAARSARAASALSNRSAQAPRPGAAGAPSHPARPPPGVQAGPAATPRRRRSRSRCRTSAQRRQAVCRSWGRTRIPSSSRVFLSIARGGDLTEAAGSGGGHQNGLGIIRPEPNHILAPRGSGGNGRQVPFSGAHRSAGRPAAPQLSTPSRSVMERASQRPVGRRDLRLEFGE